MLKLIRAFLVINAFVFSLSSCKHYVVKGKVIETGDEKFTVPYFNTSQKEYFYNADIKVFGNSIKGILVVKKLEGKRKRLALLSEFGNTLFDFEMVDDNVNVIYIMEDLNKKVIVKKLKKYFQLLVNSEFKVEKRYDLEEGEIQISKLQGKRIFLSLNEDVELINLRQASIFKSKVEISYFGDNEYADSIAFKSLELPITINLEKRN
ncbi:MAG TPA: hypothetical protein VKY37_13290 [Brumimicrobium sp.]|nr:hypothetical protein [Brumimicrobium sp.]